MRRQQGCDWGERHDERGERVDGANQGVEG